MWEEWFGLNLFSDGPLGGIEALETKYKSRWRKHFSTGNQKHFSRIKLIVKCIRKICEDKKKDVDCVLIELQDECNENGVKEVTSMERYIRRRSGDRPEVRPSRRRRQANVAMPRQVQQRSAQSSQSSRQLTEIRRANERELQRQATIIAGRPLVEAILGNRV